MSDSRPRDASRPGARTIFFAVAGLGSAALVTSVSALNVHSDSTAVAVAVVGGTALLGLSALATMLLALQMGSRADAAPWVAAGLSLVLTAAASGLRAGQMLTGGDFRLPGGPEFTYMTGMVVMGGVLVAWPLRYRRAMRTPAVTLESAVATLVVATLVWFTAGVPILESAKTYGGIEPGQAVSFLAFLALFGSTAVFTFVSAVNLRTETPIGPWMALFAAAVLVVAGDLSWLGDVTDTSWLPGSLGDFVHIAGHVMVAVGASLRLDSIRGQRPSQNSAVDSRGSAAQ